MEGRQVELPENFLLRDRFVQSRGYRTILDVYPSDNEGNWQDAGTFAALAMAYGPRYACSSALAADFTDINGHESYVDSVNTITQVQEIPTESGPLTGMIFDHCAKVINHEPEKWLQDVSHDPECPLEAQLMLDLAEPEGMMYQQAVRKIEYEEDQFVLTHGIGRQVLVFVHDGLLFRYGYVLFRCRGAKSLLFLHTGHTKNTAKVV